MSCANLFLSLGDLQNSSKVRIDKLQNSSIMILYEYAQTYNRRRHK